MFLGRLTYRFTLLLSCLILFLCAPASAETPTPEAQNGILDLRQQSITENITLNGEWLFYWNQLLESPAQINQAGLKVPVPKIWTKYDINGKSYPSAGFATYQLTVLLPKNAGLLRISMPEVYTSYKLTINGQVVSTNGRVGKKASDSEPQWQNKDVDLQLGADTLNMLLQISNYCQAHFYRSQGIRQAGPEAYRGFRLTLKWLSVHGWTVLPGPLPLR
jgi:hypothetical protein